MNKLRQCLHRRLLTRDVLLHVDTGTDFERVAEGAQVPALRKLPLSPGWAVATADEPDGALASAAALRGQAGMLYAEPQLRRLRQEARAV